MTHRNLSTLWLLIPGCLLVSSCSNGGAVSNASPRITSVPAQSATGGSTFSIDLSSYVSDREGATLTYSVTSGGGSFSGSTYSNTFDTMGAFDVAFAVSDGSKTENGTFTVTVESANFAAVREDSQGLLLLDTMTSNFLRVAGSTSTPSLAAGLTDGRLVYQIANGAGQQLWIFDPLTRKNTRVAAGESGDATYRAKTAADKIIYTTGTGNDLSLWFHNPVTGVSRDLAQGVLSSVTVLVNSAGIVFYEVGVNGQADVYGYDPDEDEVFAVGTATTDEQLQAVLGNGAVVFSRIGATGERDLFYYTIAGGLVEIAGTFGNVPDDDKTYNAYASGNQVVFTGDSGSAEEIYVWNPSNGQTYNVSTLNGAGAINAFAGLAAGDELVYTRYNGGADYDAYLYDIDSITTATLRNSTDNSNVLAVTRDGSTAWAFIRPGGSTSDLLAVSLIGSPSTVTWSAGGAVSTTLNVLGNGDVVALREDGTALNIFDASAGSFVGAITGTGLTFGGAGIDDGDFVYGATVSSQTDLNMWDASATATVAVSNATGDDTFQARTLDGTILFTRVTAPNTNQDLWVWNGTTATQLTDEDTAGLRHDHTVLGTFAGSR
ncbi:MAG: hypothetical protein KAI24_14315 [Planctomycetes bacterium]|nr:hypothetical protein [Planctomycetota bacterium]